MPAFSPDGGRRSRERLAQTRACCGHAVNSEWIHVRLAFVESLDGFKDFRPGKFTRDDEIIVNHCDLDPLFLQVPSEHVTLCFGESPVSVRILQNSSSSRKIRVSMEISRSELLIPVCICERPESNLVQCLSVVHIIGRLNCKSLFALVPCPGCSEVPKSCFLFQKVDGFHGSRPIPHKRCCLIKVGAAAGCGAEANDGSRFS